MYKYWNFRKPNDSFGAKLKSLRLAEGLTQTELAQRLNISRSTVSNYENGSREPSNEILKVISENFGVLIDYLLGKVEYSVLPLEKDKMEDFNHICRRVEAKGNSIDIGGISLGKKLAIINYCEYIMSTDDDVF